MEKDDLHEPVLVHEVTEWLHIDKARKVIDATVATAGHAVEIVKKGANVLGIDADGTSLKVAEKRLKKACATYDRNGGECFKLVHGNFRDIDEIVQREGFEGANGVLFDLGVSNPQLTGIERGFSFANPDAPLDMRIDISFQGLTGSDLVNALREDQLKVLFARVLTDFQAKRLAREIIRLRQQGRILTVGDFLRACKVIRGKPGLNPATLPFLALRIAVNSELENLKESLPKAFSLLRREGRLLVITFHSAEERVVVNYLRKTAKSGLGKILTKVAVTPTEVEVRKNPRARSAKLWVLEKR